LNSSIVNDGDLKNFEAWISQAEAARIRGVSQGNEMAIRTRVLAARVGCVPLSLRHDVELAQIQLGRVAEWLAAFKSPSRSLPRSCKYQSSANSFAFERLSSLVRSAPILSGQVGRALPARTVRTFVDVNLATKDGVMFGHAKAPPDIQNITKMWKSCVTETVALDSE